MASEYGWAKRDIYENVYLDEAHTYLRLIRQRRNENYKTLLAITQSPHTKEPNKIWGIFDENEEKEQSPAEGVARLKAAMRSNPRIKISD